MARRRRRRRGFHRVYRSRPTVPALAAAGALGVLALALIGQGIDAGSRHGWSDPFKYLSLLPPVLVGLALILTLAWLFNVYTGQEVILSPSSLRYRGTGGRFTVCWMALLHHETPWAGNRVRLLTLGDGEEYASVLNFFFPDYERLLREIRTLSEQAREEGTYSI